MLDAFELISERGVIGGLLIGTLAFVLVIGSPLNVDQGEMVWVGLICILLGFVAALVTYEVFIGLIGLVFASVTVQAFRETIGAEYDKGQDYSEIRKFREYYLASGQHDHLKERIKRHSGLRQNMSFLLCAGLFSLFSLIISSWSITINTFIFRLELIFILFLIVSTLIGQWHRSWTLGRTIGIIYMHEKQNNK